MRRIFQKSIYQYWKYLIHLGNTPKRIRNPSKTQKRTKRKHHIFTRSRKKNHTINSRNYQKKHYKYMRRYKSNSTISRKTTRNHKSKKHSRNSTWIQTSNIMRNSIRTLSQEFREIFPKSRSAILPSLQRIRRFFWHTSKKQQFGI